MTSTKRLVFITGAPGAGKSTVANRLRESGFGVLSVDEAYVAFVKSHRPELYFEALGQFIAHHHDVILADTNRIAAYCGVDALGQWRRYLALRVLGHLGLFPSVAVEGYVLTPETMTAVRSQVQQVPVLVVDVQNHRYRLNDGPEMSIDEVVAALTGGN